MKKKILIIEDEANIRELVMYNLKANGYDAIEAEDGISGITLAYKENPDLILLDIMLPGKDGYEICRELRSEGIEIPIIMLTAKSEEVDKVLGLEFGADDYIAKPFGIRELLARIKAVLRRVDMNGTPSGDIGESEENAESITAGDIVIDQSRHEVTVQGTIIDLTYKEYELLSFLAKHRGRVYSRDELLDKVWGIDYVGETRTVDVHIRHLRQKLGENQNGDDYIETIRGRGYKLK
ncbi:winged helix-turn-helix domain-containing protein [Gallibacter intestinalis]|uniref:Stage 0 sporulation protein A homolog n=1 Tax=Gallibacter intestinalis TaxID=2779356 RepID=A0ABR9QXM2_9FIRM|nr:response regulator transcription factor [Gallibacter intestinalis]MBE5035625.1 response regulator transcription factor [Gallibacter intestinalis]